LRYILQKIKKKQTTTHTKIPNQKPEGVFAESQAQCACSSTTC